MYMNFGEELSVFSEETIENVGMLICEDSEILRHDKRLFTCGLWLNKEGVKLINAIREKQKKSAIDIELIDNFESIIEVKNGDGVTVETTLNKLQEVEGNTKSLRDYVDVSFDLKFSFDETACYEDHEKSQRCPHQGYFY